MEFKSLFGHQDSSRETAAAHKFSIKSDCLNDLLFPPPVCGRRGNVCFLKLRPARQDTIDEPRPSRSTILLGIKMIEWRLECLPEQSTQIPDPKCAAGFLCSLSRSRLGESVLEEVARDGAETIHSTHKHREACRTNVAACP